MASPNVIEERFPRTTQSISLRDGERGIGSTGPKTEERSPLWRHHQNRNSLKGRQQKYNIMVGAAALQRGSSMTTIEVARDANMGNTMVGAAARQRGSGMTTIEIVKDADIGDIMFDPAALQRGVGTITIEPPRLRQQGAGKQCVEVMNLLLLSIQRGRACLWTRLGQ